MALGYVYKFYNECDVVIYVGYTRDIKKRMAQHFGNGGHLPQKCYTSVKRIECAEFATVNEAKMYEIYFISKITPKYNTEFIGGGYVTIDLPPVEFNEYPMGFRFTPKNSEDYDAVIIEVESVYHKISQALLALDVSKPHPDFVLEYSRNTARDRITSSAKGIDAGVCEIKKELQRLKKFLDYDLGEAV